MTYWQLEWLVPAANAIGGKAYWDPLILDADGGHRKRTDDEAEARSLFAKSKACFDDPVRLVRVDTTAIKPMSMLVSGFERVSLCELLLWKFWHGI